MNLARIIVGLAASVSLTGCTVLSPDATTENNSTVGAPGSDPAAPNQSAAAPGEYPTFANGNASAFVAAPGRRPMGNGAYGHADLAGNLLEQARRGSTTLASGSWERHRVGTYRLTYTENDGTNGDTVWNRRYYALGARCARR